MGLWKACSIKDTGFYVAISIFGWSSVCGRRTSFWKTLHFKNGRNWDQREVWSTYDKMIGTNARSLNDSDKGFIVSCQRLRPLGCCITTLPVTLPSPWTNVWTKRVLQCFRCPHIRLIWVLVTYSFSQNSNSTSKVVILQLWTTSKRLWQTSWVHFRMKSSSTPTGSESKVSGGVWLPKGTRLKGIMLICSSVNKKFIPTVSLLFRLSLCYFFRSRQGNSHRNYLRDI